MKFNLAGITHGVSRRFKKYRGFVMYGYKLGSFSMGANVYIDNPENVIFESGVNIDPNVQFLTGNNGRIKLGEKSTVKTGVIIRCFGGQIEIGKDCSLNPYCIIYGNAGVKIGNDVRMAANSQIYASSHIYDDINMPIRTQGISKKGVVINDNVWLGANVIILDGVTIGSGTIVAAGSVVTKSMPENVIIGGVPAKIIKERGCDN